MQVQLWLITDHIAELAQPVAAGCILQPETKAVFTMSVEITTNS